MLIKHLFTQLRNSLDVLSIFFPNIPVPLRYPVSKNRQVYHHSKTTDVLEKKIIVMAGDQAGLITFGNDMDEAINVLMSYIGEEC